jgi:hypothetical protein
MILILPNKFTHIIHPKLLQPEQLGKYVLLAAHLQRNMPYAFRLDLNILYVTRNFTIAGYS